MLSTFICSSTTALLLRVMISSIPVGTHQRPIRRLLLFPATSCICTRVLTHKYEAKCVDYYCTRTASKSYSLPVSCLLSLSLSLNRVIEVSAFGLSIVLVRCVIQKIELLSCSTELLRPDSLVCLGEIHSAPSIINH